MSLARKAALGFLSFLLFVSLAGFGLALTINRTVLNPDFIVSRLDTLDTSSLVAEVLKEQIPQEVMVMVPAELIEEVLDDVLTELEPWLKEQIAGAVYTVYDYLRGRSQSLSLAVDVAPVKEAVRDKLRQALLTSPPAGLEMIPHAELGRLFDEFYEQVSGEIPSTLEINESTLNELSPDIIPALIRARRYVGYFQIIYWALISSTALFIMGIILLDRRVRGATRWIGIPCLISGIASYVGTFVIRNFAGGLITQVDLPAPLGSWLTQLLSDSLAPMRVYGIVLMAVGVALLIVSVVYRRHHYDYLPD
jgi:hypothetical protein